MIKFHWLSHSSGWGSKLFSFIVLVSKNWSCFNSYPFFFSVFSSIVSVHRLYASVSQSSFAPAFLSPPACVSPAPPPSFLFHILYPSLFLWVKSGTGIMFSTFAIGPKQESKTYSLLAQSNPLRVFVDKVLLEHGRMRVFAHWLWLPSCHWRSRVVATETV